MTIKNLLLGGTDWISTDKIKAEDLNDTFDAAKQYADSLAPFFTDSNLYTVFDDFLTELDTTTKWTSYTYAEGYDVYASTGWSNSNNAGGVAGEASLSSPNHNYGGGTGHIQTARLTSNTLSAVAVNRHVWFRAVVSMSNRGTATSDVTASFSFGNSTDGFTEIKELDMSTFVSVASSISGYSVNILIIAKGSNVYDAWFNGKLLVEDLTLANGVDVRVQTTCKAYESGSSSMQIDDIRYANFDVV